jgi:hypothetical protein
MYFQQCLDYFRENVIVFICLGAAGSALWGNQIDEKFARQRFTFYSSIIFHVITMLLGMCMYACYFSSFRQINCQINFEQITRQ